MSCRNCKWLDVGLNAAKRRVVYQRNAYRCVVPETPMPAFPISVTRAVGFSWPPSRSHMSADDGEGCQQFELYVKA